MIINNTCAGMTVKEYLLNIKKLKRAIRLKQEEIEELRTLATSITVKTGEEPVQTSGTSDKVGNIVAKIVDLQRDMEDSMIEYLKQRAECVKLLEQMQEVDEREVLYRRYVQDMKWEEVAQAMGYSNTHVRGTLHDTAIINFENLIHNSTD